MELEENFSLDQLEKNIYLIRENFYDSDNLCKIWLSKGSSQDVIIDTGIGLWDLPGFLKSKKLIGEKPFMAVATHVHFDHTGGLHQFENTAIHEAEYDDMANANAVAMCTFVKESEVPAEASSHLDVRNYKVKSTAATQSLKDGDIIDQGDHTLQVIHLPGHSKGSIALFDSTNGHLFTGDVIYEGMILDFLPGSSVDDYINSCHVLKEIAPKARIVLPGHYRALNSLEMVSLADSYIENAERFSYKFQRKCLQYITTTLIKGRNTNNRFYNCLYCGCCCFFLG